MVRPVPPILARRPSPRHPRPHVRQQPVEQARQGLALRRRRHITGQTLHLNGGAHTTR
ncbi:hypothetical protein [Kitasatospora sp. NPDC005856]|uniref:hypothetical protein n=1 Tax=Kitasatospora sp. NPDC005856 TaxID=3154566 RepID=UPI0033DD3541